MINLLPYAIGIGTTLSSRLLLGEYEFPDFVKHELDGFADTLSDTSDFLGAMSAYRVSLWVRLGEHGVRRILESDCYRDMEEWVSENDVFNVPHFEPFAYLPALKKALKKGNCRLVKAYFHPEAREHSNIYQVDLGDDAIGYVILSESVDVDDLVECIESGKYRDYGNVEMSLYLPKDPKRSRLFKEKVAKAFWKKYGSFVEVEEEHNQLFVFDSQDQAPNYVGPLRGFPDKWREKEPKKKRVFLMRGKSGNGKTTFARYSASRLSKTTKCLSLSHESLSSLDTYRWRELCELLKPTTVIIEELEPDKLSYALKKCVFSKEILSVPYIFVSLSKDDEKEYRKPSFPLWADEIVSVDPCSETESKELLKVLIPKDVDVDKKKLFAILKKHSVGHALAEIERLTLYKSKKKNNREISARHHDE